MNRRRTLHLDRPLVLFDLETTGLNVEEARIVELGFLRFHPPEDDRDAAEIVRRVNPGIPIPPEATAVHGITDADVADAPGFASIAPELIEFCDGCDLGGFNALRYDVPVLMHECDRAGRAFPIEGRRFVDPKIIFFQREPRDLAAALRFYCGLDHEGAHGAAADVEATRKVLLGQIARYEDLPATVEELHALCMQDRADFVDFEGKLRFDADGDVVFGFGKYQGQKLRCADPGYLRWMLNQNFSGEVTSVVSRVLRGEPVRREASR